MSNDGISDETASRRRAIKFGGAVLGSGLLAGCSGQSTEDTTATERPATETATADPTETETSTPGPSYTADLAPVGEVSLEEPPENVFAHFPWFADMASALGRGETINHVWWDGTASTLEYFTAGTDGFDVEWAGKTGSYGFSKEQLYELDSDLHLVDPAWVTTQDNWADGDVDEIASNLAPWLGNYYSSTHATPPESWVDSYQYYTLWELFEQVAALFGDRARYERLASVRDDLLATIESGLPPESERPSVAYLSIATDLSAMYVLPLNASGYFNAHTRPLGAVDAFGDEEWEGAFKQIDMEGLLEADPDVLLPLWTVTDAVDFEQLVQNLRDDPVGSDLTAVQNDRVYVQGTRWQGPLMNLFQLEMTAKQLYPEQFGEWPGYGNGDSYPEFEASERLFDYESVVDTIRTDG